MNNIYRKMYNFVFDKSKRWDYLARMGLLNSISDEEYVKRGYKYHVAKDLNLEKPRGFDEKLQWLKLYYRPSVLTNLVDKYKVREYIGETIGEDYLIPLIGAWKNVDEIDYENLPNQFVLKCNHNSGVTIVCIDKNKFDLKKARRTLKKGLSQNYYFIGREWPYKNVEPLIIAERYMTDSDDSCELTDYKFMCFNGSVEMVCVCTDRTKADGLRTTYFDREWEKLSVERHYPVANYKIEKPSQIEEMIEIAEKLSKEHPFVRVDLYLINSKIYFGEMTFFPGSGFRSFSPSEWDYKIGELLELPLESIKR